MSEEKPFQLAVYRRVNSIVREAKGKSPTPRPDAGAPDFNWDPDEIFNGPAGDPVDEAPADPGDPERSLWRAVLMQTLIDATTLDTSCVYDPEKRDYKNYDHRLNALNRTRARAWVFARVGVTADDFQDVCDLAGFDAEVVRTATRRLIEEGKSFHGMLEARTPKEDPE